MVRFDAIVFDFDGVLAQSVDVKTRAFAALYEAHGREVVDRVVDWHLAHGGVSRYEKFRHFHRAFLGRELSAQDETTLGERFSILVEQAVIASAWVPGAREFLDAHYSRMPLFVASGTPETELVRIIQARGMTQYFADVAGAPRHKGEILSGFVRRAGVTASRVLMVGDSMTDYLGATEAGTVFVGIAPPHANPFPMAVPVLPDLTGLGEFINLQPPMVSKAAQ